jgi:uncharacterized DUF497 family protein
MKKAVANYARHGVTFEFASKAFADPFAVEALDDRENYDEDRSIFIGMAEGTLLTIVYTERQGRIRLISARRAMRREQDAYFIENS